MGFWFKLRSGTTLAPARPGRWSGKGGERIWRRWGAQTCRKANQAQGRKECDAVLTVLDISGFL